MIIKRYEGEKVYLTRAGNSGDAKALAEIDAICFLTPWTLEAFNEELSNNEKARYIVVEIDNKIVGYAGLWGILNEGHITNVAIMPEHRGQGLGSKVVRELIDWTKESLNLEVFTLEVRASNERGIKMYEKLGFQVAGRRTGYYSDTKEDALIMWLNENEKEKVDK